MSNHAMVNFVWIDHRVCMRHTSIMESQYDRSCFFG